MPRPRPARLIGAVLLASALGSAGVLAPASAQPPPALLADHLEGVWEGKYSCYQGPTAVSVTLGALDATGTTRGTFTFGSFPGTTNARAGKYALAVTFDDVTQRLVAVPAGWIEQPENYIQVGFTATVDATGQTMAGRIDYETCSSIDLHRRAVS